MRRLALLIAIILLLIIVFAIPTESIVAQSTECPGAPPPRLEIGGQAQVAQSYSTIRDDITGDPLRVVNRAENAVLDVLNGPYCYSIYYWWKVEYDDTIGWVAEGVGDIYWLSPFVADEFGTGGPTEPDLSTDDNSSGRPNIIDNAPDAPACPGAPESRLTVGEEGQVAEAYSNIRAEIGSADVLRTMYSANDDTFTVVDGPFCAGPHHWWQIEFDDVTGWATEGTNGHYWLAPLTENAR